MKATLESIMSGQSLTREQARALMLKLAQEQTYTPEQVAALLVSLRRKGETADELLGFVDAMMSQAVRVDLKDGEEKLGEEKLGVQNIVDVCGTGGDRHGTFNVSTAVAIVLGSCGVAVAKHGNRGVSSRSGSSDVLEALGISCDRDPHQVRQSLESHGLSFLFAPAFHPLLAQFSSIRKNLGIYTLFNALGPLLNPAPLTHQMMGVYDRSLMPKVARVLQARGLTEALVIHGSDGLDEITLTGPTHAMRVTAQSVESLTLHPEQFGLPGAEMRELLGGSALENAEIIQKILGGEKGARRDLVVINAAAALELTGQAKTKIEAVAQVCRAIDSGRTRAYLENLKGART